MKSPHNVRGTTIWLLMTGEGGRGVYMRGWVSRKSHTPCISIIQELNNIRFRCIFPLDSSVSDYHICGKGA